MRKTVVITLSGLFSVLLLAGCNTIEGLGKDVKRGGEKIEKAAERAKS